MTGPWVELRVHGVSGTPPESLLGVPHATQVAGDDRSRFFRPADELDRPAPAADGHTVEAYHWGRWTAGSWQQGLWLLLIPFGIVNAAQFMLPGPRPDRRGARWAHAACGAALRAVALCLTVLFALGLTVVLADLVGWQWQAVGRPGADRWVAAGLTVTGLGVVGLSLLGRLRTGGVPAPDTTASTPGLPDLNSRFFYEGDPDSPALRRLHVAAGLQVPAVSGWSVAIGTPRPWWVWVVLVGPMAAVLVAVVLLGDPQQTVSQNPAPYERRRTGVGRRRVATWLLAVSALLLVAAVVRVLAGAAVVDSGQALPAVDATTAVLAAVATAAMGTLLVANAVLAVLTRSDTPELPAPFRRFCGGVLGSLAAAIGVFLGIGFTAATSLAVQRAVNSTSRPDGAPGSPGVEVPPFLERVSYTWGVAAVAAVVGVAVLLVRGRVRRGRFRARARAAAGSGLPPAWAARVAAAMVRARWKNYLQVVVVGFAGLGVVLSIAAVAVELVGRPPGTRTDGCPDPAVLPGPFAVLTGVGSCRGLPVTPADVLVFLGSAALLGLGAALLFVVRNAVRTTTLRRTVNTVWDVVSFWPRAVHPFVPPPYAQRVVQPLVDRVRWHLGHTDDRWTTCPTPAEQVVLAAHSQGSLITVLALLRLPAADRARVSWVTCGSQLRVLFPRAFPHYVTYPLLTGLAVRYGWISLYRDTDPIGGPVLSWGRAGEPSPTAACTLTAAPHPDAETDAAGFGWWSARFVDGYPAPAAVTPSAPPGSRGRLEFGREWRLLDPPAADATAQDRARSGTAAHSDYWRDPAWCDALTAARAGPDSVLDEEGDG